MAMGRLRSTLPAVGAGNETLTGMRRNFLFDVVYLRVRRDGLLRAFVDVELKNIRARIMTNDVQIIFAANNLRTIDFGDQNGLALEVRACQKIAKRVDDATAPARHDGVRIFTEGGVIVHGKIVPAIELIAGKDEAASLDSNVAHGV